MFKPSQDQEAWSQAVMPHTQASTRTPIHQAGLFLQLWLLGSCFLRVPQNCCPTSGSIPLRKLYLRSSCTLLLAYALHRGSGLPHSNGNMEMHTQTLQEGFVGKTGEAASTALRDTAAGLPDDVFTPEDIRSTVDPGSGTLRGAPAAGGGRRGGRGRMGGPPMRGVAGGRGAGYGRGRGREAADGLPMGGHDGSGHQRRREGPQGGGQQRAPQGRRHPAEGVPPQEGGGRDGAGRGRGGGGRGRGARAGQPSPITAWVPLQQGA